MSVSDLRLTLSKPVATDFSSGSWSTNSVAFAGFSEADHSPFHSDSSGISTPLSSLFGSNTALRDVRRAAYESALRYSEDRPLGPLDGIPVALKNELDVQGHATRTGSAITPVTESTVDSWYMEKLRKAGAIIIGKVTIVEFGIGKNTFRLTPAFHRY
ncbi:hypothetical protein F4779DRAFT_624526 [Xylariaceae sp. FL0662B]|nr:hypothetical protein F4779DRAFT_624526 [Xylariaceae sp. FL0662B]